jgi:outer membrane protein OmpA-like peptidoglycan-associated protein
MDLRGKYANSAPVEIQGKLNPLAAKSFLDIKAAITGVDLTGFSPYSGKYAGYAIEKGKLSLNVAYKLENKQLAAENRLFIDQFTFGDKVESPDATTLPVNLAISLLKNNRGEIDLNLPISGSLDDPQFSIGGLIVKVIVNLFVKAVTSPFALLGSMFGSGEELSNVEFAAGRAGIDAAANKRLESLAKALVERNSLKLEITGRADPEVDKDGVKRVAIERAMKAEKLKDLKKAGEGKSLEDIDIAPTEYKTYLTRAYKEAKFPKPRNVIGMQKELPVEEMEKLMLANLPATDDDIKALADRRAETVQGWLVEQGKVPPERVFLLPSKVEHDDKGKGSRADFSLR